jgi:hypothetical protein
MWMKEKSLLLRRKTFISRIILPNSRESNSWKIIHLMRKIKYPDTTMTNYAMFMKKLREYYIHRMLVTSQLSLQNLSSACLIPKNVNVHWLLFVVCTDIKLGLSHIAINSLDYADPENYISIEWFSLSLINKSLCGPRCKFQPTWTVISHVKRVLPCPIRPSTAESLHYWALGNQANGLRVRKKIATIDHSVYHAKHTHKILNGGKHFIHDLYGKCRRRMLFMKLKFRKRSDHI